MKVGLVFARGPHKTRYFTSYGPTAGNLVIPAGDSHAEVVSEVTATTSLTGVCATAHAPARQGLRNARDSPERPNPD